MTHAPGGQLIQAIDQWMAVRNARVVVADDELVRVPIVAAWLRELGFDAHVLAAGPNGRRRHCPNSPRLMPGR